MQITKRTMFGLLLLSAISFLYPNVKAEECGTRFTDFTSSVVLAEVVLQGSVNDFKPSPVADHLRMANISVANVYKGMDILKSTGRMSERGDLAVQSFGQENRENCVATAAETMRGKDMVFFLRQSQGGQMLEHSALPLPVEGNEDRRVKRSLCDSCIEAPTIRRLVCKDCAKLPFIKPMKSKKVTMGRRGRLQCKVRGKPAPTITWYKGQVPVMSGNGGIVIRNSSLTSTLIFSRTTSAHSGQYTCHASNKVGEVEEIVTLEVSRKSRQRGRRPQPNGSADRVECQDNLCLNGGICFFSPSLNLRQCVCATAYEGVRCENIAIEAFVGDSNINNHDRTVTTTLETSTSTTSRSAVNTEINPEKVTTSATVKITSQIIRNNQSFLNKVTPTRPSRAPYNNVTAPSSVRQQTSNNPTVFNPPTRPTVVQPNRRHTSRYSSNGQAVYGHPVSRKSSLKIIPCKEKNYCSNRGKCRFIRKLNKKFCQCRSGYGGLRCERIL